MIAFKGKEGPCDDYHEAVIYRGPFKKVIDDDGRCFERGVRSAVCQKTFAIMAKEPYADSFIPVPPRQAVAETNAQPMVCDGSPRSPRVTKGEDYRLTIVGQECCDSDGCC